MVFTQDSMIVQLWVKWINKGEYSLEQVPQLFNLYDEVERLVVQ